MYSITGMNSYLGGKKQVKTTENKQTNKKTFNYRMSFVKVQCIDIVVHLPAHLLESRSVLLHSWLIGLAITSANSLTSP